MVSVQYYDGIGRPSQTVATSGMNGETTYSMKTYDMYGRTEKVVQPFSVGQTYDYMQPDDVVSALQSAYGDEYMYSHSHYDALGRVTTIEQPGKEWRENNKSERFDYGFNTDNDRVLHYKASISDTKLYKPTEGDKYYPAGSLQKETSYDADGKTITVFYDFYGNKVLERRASDNDTYFVYDEYCRLRFVLSPEYQKYDHKDKLAYEYRYDSFGRLVKKILPGCEYIQYWYDGEDRLTYMQDATLREKGLYRFMFYDKLGRLAVQGTCSKCDRSFKSGTPQANFKEIIEDTPFGRTYIKTTVPSYDIVNINKSDFVVSEIEVVYYYDKYDYLGNYSLKDWQKEKLERYGFVNTTGKLTGSCIYASNGEYLFNVIHYDNQGRAIRTFMSHLTKPYSSDKKSYPELSGLLELTANEKSLLAVGGIQETLTEYTYTDKPKTIKVTEFDEDGNVQSVVGQEYEYNVNNDQLQNAYLLVNGEKKTIKQSEYDALGRLVYERSGNNNDKRYSYNKRNWLASITSANFNEQLYYNEDCRYPSYNGNISRMAWNNNDGHLQINEYRYDDLNRLSDSYYTDESVRNGNNKNRFREFFEYSRNGALKRVQRSGRKQKNGYGVIDDLYFELDGNQLYTVHDSAPSVDYAGATDFNDNKGWEQDFWYNGNGALVADANKGIAHIDYDNMNNPRRIVFTNGNTTEYVYSYAGEKLRTIHKTAVEGVSIALNSTDQLESEQVLNVDSTDYHGSFIYENGHLNKYLFGDGYVQMEEKYFEANAKLRNRNIVLTSMVAQRENEDTWPPVHKDPKPWPPIDTDPEPLPPVTPIYPGDPVLPFPKPDPSTAPLVQDTAYQLPHDLIDPADYEFKETVVDYASLPYVVAGYYYYVKDHLGNVRVVLNENGNVEQKTNYYAFGGVFCTNIDGYNKGQDLQPYKYNGKELDRTHGLDWYDYGARNYDATLCQFTTIDPLCEKYYHISPYAYCANNPIIAIDPTGCDSVFAKKLFSGTIYYIGDDGKNTGNVYVVKGKTKRAVIAATKEGKNYSEDLTKDLKHTAIIPRGKAAEQVNSDYETKRSDGRELGGCQYPDGTIQQWDLGTEPQIVRKPDGKYGVVHSISPFFVNGKETCLGTPDVLWHIHTMLDVPLPNGEIAHLGLSAPSDRDYSYEKDNNTGSTFVVGQRDRRVQYYHDGRNTISLSWKVWKKLAGL